MMYFFNRPATCRWLVLYVIAVVAYSTPLAAQQIADTAHIKELTEVTVMGNRQRFGLSSPTPMQSLSGERLQRLNSFSVADAVRYFSGVQLKDYGGIGGLKTINVRSMGTQHVGVFIDGLSMGNVQNGTVDLGKFSLDHIEEIQLYNGHNATLLQPAKAYFASSTLYLKTRRPQFLPPQKTHLQGSFKTGSFGLINPSILWQQPLKKNLSLSLNTEYIKAHGRYQYRYKKEGGYDTTAIRNNADIEGFRTEAALFKKLSGNGETFFKAYIYNSERGLPGAIVANRYYNSQRLWDRNIFVHASYKNNISDKYEIQFHAKYANDYTRYVDPEFIMTTGVLDNRYHQQETYLSLAQQYHIKPWWKVALSTDFSFHRLDANLYRFAYPKRYAYVGALANQFQWQRLMLQAALLYCYYDEHVKYYEGSPDRKATSPMIGISWQPLSNNGFRLRSFYKESLRMPTFNDLYYTLIGNTQLQPEYTRQFDFGFTWSGSRSFLKNIAVQADAYYNRVSNKIIAVPSTNLFRWMMINQGLVEIKGIEANVSLTSALREGLQLITGLNYTFQKAVNKTDGESSYNHQIPYTPVHSGTLHGSLLWKAWSLNYSFIYTGERYMLPENTRKNYMQPWYTTDVGLVWEKGIGKNKYKIGAEVNNVFNQYFDVVINYPMPGRNYRFTFSVTI